MQVKVIAPFNDMSIEDADARRREVGVELDVDDARGVELIALRLVEPTEATDPALPLTGGTTLRLGADVTAPIAPVATLTPSTPTAPVVAQP